MAGQMLSRELLRGVADYASGAVPRLHELIGVRVLAETLQERYPDCEIMHANVFVDGPTAHIVVFLPPWPEAGARAAAAGFRRARAAR